MKNTITVFILTFFIHFFSVNSNQFRRLVNKLNKLRGKSKRKIKSNLSTKLINSSSEKQKLFRPYNSQDHNIKSSTLSRRKTLSNLKQIETFSKATKSFVNEKNLKIDNNISKILQEFKDFLKFIPMSPIPLSPPLEDSQIDPKPVKLILTIPPTSNDFHSTDNSKPNILNENSQKFGPLAPITFSKLSIESRDPRISSNSSTYNKLSPNSKNYHKNLRCNKHNHLPSFKPCIDCFFKNYFKNDPYPDQESLEVSRRFRNAFFPDFHRPGFDIDIENTEIPLFHLEKEHLDFNVIASCKQHIFTHRTRCDICILMNTSKQ